MRRTFAHTTWKRWAVRVALAMSLAGVSLGSGLALDPAKRIGHYQRDLWQTRNGLPQNDVFAILQTRDGYLWVGTEEGLGRFDGVAFTVFDKRNTPQLRVNNIASLFEDRAGRLWIGTKGGGLCRYADGAFTSYTTEDGLSNNQVWAILEDRAGRLWVGTGAGLDRFENGTFTAITVRDGLSADNIRAICEDRQGRIWVGTVGGGVNRIENGAVTPITTRDGLSNDFVQAIRETRDGSIWIGTAGGGLNRFADGALTVLTTRQGLSSDFIWSIYEDASGSLWIGSKDAGLNRIRDGAITSFKEADGLSSNSVLSICEDREGSLWVGTGSGGGLNRFKDGKVVVLTTRDGLPHMNVRSVCETRDGSLWVATENGLARFKDGQTTVLTERDGLLGSDVTSLREARDGSLWIGIYGKGVNRLQDGRLTSYTAADGLANPIVRLIYEDRDGRIWMGTNRGAAVFRDGVFSAITTDDGLSSDVVTSIYQDRNGIMWIGTYGGGLDRVEGDAKTVYTTNDGLTSNNIRFTFEDAEGGLWIGTEGGGIDRLESGRFAAITVANGLHDDTAFDELADGRGNLWLNCNKGIFRVGMRELDDVADGRAGTVSCVSYGMADGMLSAECNSGIKPGSWMLRNGKLAFATNKGLVLLDPAHIRSNEILPPVFVERVLVDRKPLAPGESPSIPPGAESFEFHYTALSLRVPERVQFKYMLEGWDHDWIDAGTRRTAYYTNIPHGSYRFRVIACNDDGLWNETGATFAFTLEPFFYQTWWFYLISAAVVALVAVGAYRARIHRLKARERELIALVDERTMLLREEMERTESERAEAERQSTRAEEANRAKSDFLATMSHELRTPLNAVIGFAQLMERDLALAAEHRESVATIMRSGEHLLGLINDVLSLSKIEAGKQVLAERVFDLREMLELLLQMTRVRSEEKGLDLRAEIAEDLPCFVRADEGKLRQILLNLLSNAVKFTASGSVTLRVQRAGGERVVFEVEDTGPGIAPEELRLIFTPFVQTQSGLESREGTGLGLTLSRSFALLMGGDIQVMSEVGRWTTFRVEIALPEADETESHAVVRRALVLAPGEPAYKVLVVDDVRENRLLLVRLLEAAGFDVREAANGREAIEVWRTWHPAVILMDVRMPGIDGPEATRRIRNDECRMQNDELKTEPGGEPSTSDIHHSSFIIHHSTKIIAVSASVLDHDIEHVLAAGCDDFLPKPFREATLFEKIGALTGARFEGQEIPVAGAGTPPPADMGLESLRAAAPELVERLERAVVVGDVEEGRRVASEIRRVDDVLGKRLEEMFGHYQFDELEQLTRGPSPETEPS